MGDDLPDPSDPAADWERLRARIAEALRKLPLQREGFEARTRIADWGFLELWPIGEDLESVIRQRADDIAFGIMKRRELGPRRCEPRAQPRDASAKIARQHARHARSLGPDADWGLLLFEFRCEVKRAQLELHRVTKEEIVEQIAFAYFELTGRRPSMSYTTGRATRFERLGYAVFVDEPWLSTGKAVCRNFPKKM
jgi:hypothetical protein